MSRALITVLLSLAVCGLVFAAPERTEGIIKVTTDAAGKKVYTFNVKEGGKDVAYTVESNDPGNLDRMLGPKDGQKFEFPSSLLSEKDGKKIISVRFGRPGSASAPNVPMGRQTLIGVLKTERDTGTLTVKTGDREVVYKLEEGKEVYYAGQRLNGKTVEVIGDVRPRGDGVVLEAHEITAAPVKVTGVLKVAKDGMTVTAKEGGKDVVYNLSRPNDERRPMPAAIKAITEKAKAFDGKTVEVVGVVYENVPGLGLVLDQREIKEAPATK